MQMFSSLEEFESSGSAYFVLAFFLGRTVFVVAQYGLPWLASLHLFF
jgi:hypothetical protein